MGDCEIDYSDTVEHEHGACKTRVYADSIGSIEISDAMFTEAMCWASLTALCGTQGAAGFFFFFFQ
jgi:hypothetical protein